MYSKGSDKPMVSKIYPSNARHLIIQGNIEALHQAAHLLNMLSDTQFSQVPSQYAESSIGQHTRHILDIYDAVLNSEGESGFIDYDQRRRGSNIEAKRSVALAAIERAKQDVSRLEQAAVWSAKSISTEVLLSSKEPVMVGSNLERELVFAASHAVHHLALMRVIAKLLGVAVPEYIGVAPTTASFLREHCAKV